MKLHQQFSHVWFNRLQTKNSWIDDKEVHEMLEWVIDVCEIYLKYKKAPSKPVVGLSVAWAFNEIVAVDLKEWTRSHSKTWFLHLIYHAIRYSASPVKKPKKKKIIVENIFKIWIKIFRNPKKMLVDNWGEFNKQEFRD